MHLRGSTGARMSEVLRTPVATDWLPSKKPLLGCCRLEDMDLRGSGTRRLRMGMLMNDGRDEDWKVVSHARA